jgi:membrane associated rhomboid family serine protease
VFFPLGDDNSQRTIVPVVTFGLIALNIVAFLLELSASAQGNLEGFVRQWSVIPASYTRGSEAGGPVGITLFTAMFLHGGWAHIIGNMLYLFIFGDNVEHAFGHAKFLLFYLVTGVAASFAHIFSDPASTLPSLGASGAISGVLGAYLIMFPKNPVRVLMWNQVRAVPALVVIGLWAVMQLISGVGSIVQTEQTGGGGGVAYMAHIGGFVAGLVLTFLLRPRGASLRAA